jgi:glycine oxidase
MKVIVIGAGVIGCACAESLAAAGLDVHVIDMRGPGRGASQASAGVLAPFIEAGEGEPLLDLCAESLSMYDAFVANAREKSGRAIEYARTGTLDMAMNEAEAAKLRSLESWLAGRRISAEWLEGPALRAAEPAASPSAVGGLFIPAHGFVSVPDLVAALAQAARFQGATFENPVEAVRVDASKSRTTVIADGRAMDADAVVVAAGSWSGRVRIANLPAIDVRPIRGQLLHLAWPDHAAMPARVVWASRCYTVPWANRTLLVGATVEDVGFDERSTAAGIAELLAAVNEILPASTRAALSEVRVGLRPAASTSTPLIGPIKEQPRVILATGHYRNGVMLAPITAARVRDAVLSV